jgi:hypothetical protein
MGMKRPLNRNLLGALVLAALPFAALAAGPAASQWEIGPIIRGKNYSVNMPPTLEEGRGGPGFEFPFPTAAQGHVHYITVPVGSLEGARRITLTYRIDAARRVRFVPQEVPGEQATLSLYFQRAGDRWTARTPHHRWYAPNDRQMPLTPGTHTVSIALDEPWVAMMGGDGRTLPDAFARAKAETAEVGFVFGSAGLRGHGVYATGPARFTVLDFEIE